LRATANGNRLRRFGVVRLRGYQTLFIGEISIKLQLIPYGQFNRSLV
jgi:hypothetical protein